MALFKSFRDRMKAKALLLQLERAKESLGPGFSLTSLNLTSAHKTMEKIKEANSKGCFSTEGWLRVIVVCEDLGKTLKKAGREDLVSICLQIYQWALENENGMEGDGMLSLVASSLSKDEGMAQFCAMAAMDGDAEAQFNLGLIYGNGRGVPKDECEAVRWYKKAAGQGHVKAQFNLGAVFDQGRGVPKDEGEAFRWYKKAADQGYIEAQFSLGTMYEGGQGIPKDDVKAVLYYKQAATHEHAWAQYFLGVMYVNGRGVPKDECEAVRWWTKAADHGNADAQYNLGVMNAKGRGCPKDDVRAYARFSVAAALGEDSAKAELVKIERILTLSSRRKAEELAKQFLSFLEERKKR